MERASKNIRLTILVPGIIVTLIGLICTTPEARAASNDSWVNDCVSAAYKEFGITKPSNQSDELPIIRSVCSRCYNDYWGKLPVYLMVPWINNSKTDAYQVGVVLDNQKSGETKVYERIAGLSCGGEQIDNTDLFNRHFNNFQSGIGDGKGGLCPTGTTLRSGSGKNAYPITIPNCDNDGFSSDTALSWTLDGVTRSGMMVSGSNEFNRTSLSYLYGINYSYGSYIVGPTITESDGGDGKIHWIKPGEPAELKLNLDKFIAQTTSSVKDGYDVYSSKFYTYGCPSPAYPGMSIEEYDVGCGTVEDTITVRVMKSYTLTAYAAVNGTYNASTDSRKYFKSDGTITDKKSEAWSTTVTVNYGDTAKADLSKFNPKGYSWGQWGSSCNSETGRICSISNMTANKEVFAYYNRNEFSGRASVANGTTWGSSGNVRDLTGWTQENKSVSINVDCANTGCNTNFWLELKTIKGSGSTGYWTGISKNGGAISWTPPSGSTAFSIAPGTGGTIIVGKSSSIGEAQSLKPGGSVCRQLAFYPNVDTAWKTVEACASAKVTTFTGQSNVMNASGTTIGSAGFSDSSQTKTIYIDNCSGETGCKVSFNHKLKSSGGLGSTTYIVSRETNLNGQGVAHAISNNDELKKGTFSSNNNTASTEYTSETLTLFPGMKVCEKISFYPSNDSTKTVNQATVAVCAYAKGEAQPGGDDAFLNLKVKNDSVYNTYQGTVYAKPTNVVTFRATYSPKLQYTYYLIPGKMKIKGLSATYPASGTNKLALGPLFNNAVSSMRPNPYNAWQNGFTVTSRGSGSDSINIDGTGSRNLKYKIGVVDTQYNTNQYTVKKGDVGKTLSEKALTNEGIKTAPRQVSFDGNQVATVDVSSIESTASVIVPYNFITNIDVFPKNDTVSAGERNSATINVDVLPKTNSLTTKGGANEAYATKMEKASLKIIVYAPQSSQSLSGVNDYGNKNSDLCAIYLGRGASECSSMYVANNTLTFNANGDLEGSNDETYSANFNVPDLDAGREVCVAAAVYPSYSGKDDNINVSGSGQWRVSASKCFMITKKPNLQVWGGGVYSEQKLSTNVSEKRNVYGVSGFNVGNNDKYVFGSFAELNVTSRKEVSGFASGASTGYRLNNNNGTLWPSFDSNNENSSNIALGVGGSYETQNNFCLRSVLTFANNSCSSGTAGGLGGSGGNVVNENKENLIAVFRNNQEKENINYLKQTDDYNITVGDELDNIVPGLGVTNVVAAISGDGVVANRDITISGDISFLDSGSGYSSLEDVPKLILYGKNIWIDCDVSRVDAVLIAEEAVVTCYNTLGPATAIGNDGKSYTRSLEDRAKDQINSQRNSKQLVINGAIITDQLVANRTYGAGKGANSIVPAEIVNYDATLYLWGANKTDVSNTAKITTTYTRELSPRY